MHESQMHDRNAFITLTYDPEHLPADGSLNKKHFQDFMKRLRKRLAPRKIRFYHCGEYGEKLSRPHYHAIIFGWDFPDKKFWKKVNGLPLYTSVSLEASWSDSQGRIGFATVGDVTFQSAAYVARYILKKQTGENAIEHYVRDSPHGDTVHRVEPEYTTMSRRPGIGKGWFEKFHSDVYPGDFVVHAGKKLRTPRYYDQQMAVLDDAMLGKIKKERVRKSKKHAENNTPERLRVRETIQAKKLQRLIRPLEQEI